MPRGLRRNGDPASLERRDDIDSTYWGGALFALLADVKIRVTTRGQRSLDDVVRAALTREGDASHTARLADFLRIGDEATGTRALAEVNDAWAVRGENVDLDLLWRQLGVDAKKTPREGAPREGEGELAELEDGAPLAAVRAAISASDGH
jgi:predicted metalloprotease with PDZ domain